MSTTDDVEPDGIPLACPNCGETTLYSDEVASIMYPATFTRAADGTVTVDYTGGERFVLDEGTEYIEEIWCRSCGLKLTEEKLVPTEGDDDE